MTPRFELFVVADLLYFERRVMRHFIFQGSKVVNCCLVRADDKVYEVRYNPAHRHQYMEKPAQINTGWYASSSLYLVEYYIEEMTREEYEIFYALAHAKKATIRFSGADFQSERDLSQKALAAYRRMFDFYEAMIS